MKSQAIKLFSPHICVQLTRNVPKFYQSRDK